MVTFEWLTTRKWRENPYSRLYRNSVVSPTGCIEYQGALDQYGYGRFKIGGRQLGAHKVSYILHEGDYDQSNLELGHSCDNPSCINPKHLTPVTHAENIQQSLDRGRHSSQQNWFHGRGRMGARKEALEAGALTYIGSECQKHGCSIRKTNNGSCIDCAEEYKVQKREDRKSARQG